MIKAEIIQFIKDKEAGHRKKYKEFCEENPSVIGSSPYAQIAMGAATILREQKKNTEALEILVRHKVRSKNFGPKVLKMVADINAEMGKKEKAKTDENKD